MSSYEIIFPDSRQIVLVNARPGERVDARLIISSSPTDVAMIQCYEDIQSMLFDDGGPAYTTRVMENGLISLDGSRVLDHETCVMVASYVMEYESLGANENIQEHSMKIGGNSSEGKEGMVCVICQEEFQTGEMCAVLECEHGYHQRCLEKWLQQKNDCPICRAQVFQFLSKICMFRVGS